MKVFLWLLFIVILLIMGQEVHVIATDNSSCSALWKLEFADCTTGKAMLHCLQSLPYGNGSLLEVARSNTHTDFILIILYVILLLIHSNSQMQQERLSCLNTLLRLNLLLAILTGLLDVAENLILLYDMRHVADPGHFIPSQIVSVLKWFSGGWTVLILLISITHKLLTGKYHRGWQSATDVTVQDS